MLRQVSIVVWLIPRKLSPRGEYVSGCRVVEPSGLARDMNKTLGEKLWKVSEAIIVEQGGFELQHCLQ